MICHQCKQEIKGDVKKWNGGIYDLGLTIPTGKEFSFTFHPHCLPEFIGERARFFDDLDEVMNVNKYFQRTKGMEGNYVKDGKSYPVSAYWKRGDIEFSDYPNQPTALRNERIQGFQKWLKENNLQYEYIHR